MSDDLRDQVARDLYIHSHDDIGASDGWRLAGAAEWDTGGAKPEDVAQCHRRAAEAVAALPVDMPADTARLTARVLGVAAEGGRDYRDVLAATPADADTKAAVAEHLGGPAAGAEFARDDVDEAG